MFSNGITVLDVAINAVRNGYDGGDLNVIYDAMQDAGYQGGPIVVEETQDTNRDVIEVEFEADRVLSGEHFEANHNVH